MDIYANYIDFVKDCSIQTFKSSSRYTYMLEHVTGEQGAKYYNMLLQVGISNENIQTFCATNDSIGTPNKYYFPNIGRVSPTSLRYLYHAYLALQHMPANSNIVEIGAGYGGLCLAIHFVSALIGKPINSYNCIDLDPASQLQKKYLSNFKMSFPVYFHSASTYGSDIQEKNLFLISTYCFSEITDMHQKRYISTLFPKVSNGFIVWNNIPVYDFGKKLIRREPEIPKTGEYNQFVYF